MPTISTTDYLLDQAKRRINTPIQSIPGMARVEKRLRHTTGGSTPGRTPCRQRSQARDGRCRAADPRPHGRAVPRRSRLLVASVPQPRTNGAARYADHSDGGSARPRRDSGDLLQPQQGLLAAGLGPHDRGLLQPRTDVAGFRRAHVPPPDHAGGVRPHPVGRLHRASRQGRLAGGRQRLGCKRRPLPAVSRR